MSIVSSAKNLESLSLLLVAEFDAPIERVWQLWADPRQLERWWGPPTHPATVEKHDLTVGGEVSYFMRGPAGEESRGWWRVSSVNPPRWLEFTDGFARQDGTPNAEMPTTQVQMRLLEHGSGTRMELRFVFASREHMEQLERWGAFEVFPQSVGQIDALLSADLQSDGSQGSAAEFGDADRHFHGPLERSHNEPGDLPVRKIKSNFFISLDGVVEAPDKWHFPYFDDEMGAAVSAGFATADAMLMGRVLYNEWAAYWPEHADEPFGDVMNSMQKYVLSNSLPSAEWQNTECISGDVASKLTDIKAGDGGDIATSGSPTTVRWLLREGLLDELNLLVHPIVVGDGLARLFAPEEPTVRLELQNAKTFKSGVLNLSYVTAKD